MRDHVNVTASVAGVYTNTIPVGALTTSGGSNTVAASATLSVGMPSFTVAKSVLLVSDPVNGTTLPKAIPGAVVQYSILVTNSGAGTATNNTTVITDPIPANTRLFVGDLGVAGLRADRIRQRHAFERLDLHVHQSRERGRRRVVLEYWVRAVYHLHTGARHQWIRCGRDLHSHQSKGHIRCRQRRQQPELRSALPCTGELNSRLPRTQHARREVGLLQRATLPENEAGIARQIQLFFALDAGQHECLARQSQRVDFARHLLPRFFA